jgi:hypothetical protein
MKCTSEHGVSIVRAAPADVTRHGGSGHGRCPLRAHPPAGPGRPRR